MRIRLKHALMALVGLLCLAIAYSPLFQAGFLASDYRALVSAIAPAKVSPGERSRDRSAALDDAPGLAPAGTIPKFLEQRSLALSATLYGVLPLEIDHRASASLALPFRAENLALLGLAALGLAFFLRRLLLPWTGNESARAAGQAAGLILLLHPLSISAVGSLASRGDLLAACFGLWSAACFLRGRQDRLPLSALMAFLLALAAGLASDLALGLGPILFLAELLSSRRYRPFSNRLRTASTSLAIFGLATCLDRVRAVFHSPGDVWPPTFRALEASLAEGTVAQVGGGALEKLGLLVLPVNTHVLGLAGMGLAGALFLIAVQPALWAARSAPRLWGWFLGTWFLSLLASMLLQVHVSIGPGEFWQSRSLFPSVVILAAGLGIASTALSSPRRLYVSWLVAIGMAAIAHGNARPWRTAAHLVDHLRADLAHTRQEVGAVPIWVVDPPTVSDGMEPLEHNLDVLVRCSLLGSEREGDVSSEALEVVGIRQRAFLALVGEPELEMRVTEGMALLFPSHLSEEGAEAPSEAAEGHRMHRVLLSQTPSSGPRSWSGTLSSPKLDLSTWNDSVLRVTIPADEDPKDLARISWLSKSGQDPTRGSVPGVWTPAGEQQVGVFDLGSSLAWRLGGRVRRLLFEKGSRPIRRAEIWSALPTLESAQPERDGTTWTFPAGERVLPLGCSYHLELVDTRTMSWSEYTAEGQPGAQDAWVFRGVAVPEAASRGDSDSSEENPGSGRWLWSLEARLQDHAVARSRGRH